jgi:hypothetical protein
MTGRSWTSTAEGNVMYESYPVSAATSQEPARIGPPRSLVRAARLMYAGAAAELVAMIIDLISTNSFRSDLRKLNPHDTAAQLHDAEVARVGFLVVIALITLGLWLWMSWANGRGLRWARVVSAVLFGLSTLELIVEFHTAYTAGTLTIGIVIWLIGLVVILLLFSKESGPFYRQQSHAGS